MSATTKTPLAAARQTAEYIANTLAPFCDRIEIAGSIRRGRPQVGDIELVALPRRPVDLFGVPQLDTDTALDQFLAEKQVPLIKNGRKYKQFKYGRYTVDLFLPESPAHWGSIYTIRTGSHEFNMWIMNTRARQVGVRFVGGLLYTWGRELIPTPEEEDVFAALQMGFVPPERRDDGGWLEYLTSFQRGCIFYLP